MVRGTGLKGPTSFIVRQFGGGSFAFEICRGFIYKRLLMIQTVIFVKWSILWTNMRIQHLLLMTSKSSTEFTREQ